uniref:Uncharacterized protein n=1 Tax=Plectus sambesii TaxID=2011161 RepID=A0A914XDI9_9BILA
MLCSSIILSLSLFVTISSQGCPDGWRPSEVITNKCYYVGVKKDVWFEAEGFCKNAQPNAYLTSITSAFENGNVNAVVISTLSVSACDQFWIGANDFDVNGHYGWADGGPWNYANWASGQPDSTQHCASSTARTTGLWKTEPCGIENCFICEMYLGGSGSTFLPPTTTSSMIMTDCKDWFNHGAHTDGIYSINPDGRGSFNVFCDMTTDGGGWTVFQRHTDASISFYEKLWNDYKVGFNNGLENNLWLGNDIIHALTTKDSNVDLRTDLWGDRNPSSSDTNGYWWEKRTNFSIDIEANFYKLHLSSNFTGNATLDPHSNMYDSSGKNFSTIDSINDYNNSACFSTYQRGGWWYGHYCAYESLNGIYIPTKWGTYYGFCWNLGPNDNYINPMPSRMMLRRVI